MISRRDAEVFATRIFKEARYSVRVKIGRTNGRPVYHVTNNEPTDRSRATITLKHHLGEWLAHDWNKINRLPKRVRSEPEVNLEEVTEGVQALGEGYRRFTAKARAATESIQRLSAAQAKEVPSQ